jgi:signal transduction histidine kinase
MTQNGDSGPPPGPVSSGAADVSGAEWEGQPPSDSSPLYYDGTTGGQRLSDLAPSERAVLDFVNQKVAAAESLEAIVDFLFDATQPVFPCDRIAVAFVEDGGERLVAHHARAAYEPLLLKRGYAEDLADSSLQRVLRERQPRIIRDLEAYLAEHPQSRSTRLLLREGVRSSLTCPLVVEDRVAGVLFRSSRRPRAYGRREVGLHLAVAERLSQAVEKARRIEQLAEANRAYTEMLGFVSHELKSPVASIVMDARMIGDEYLGPVTEKQRAKLGSMMRKAEYLLGLVREYLDLARIEGGDLGMRPRTGVDLLREIVEPSVEIVRPQLEASGMRLELAVDGGDPPGGAPLLVEADPDLLKIVVVNLIGNGIKYGNPGGRLQVRASLADTDLTFSVWNEGPGFPESQRARLFRRFSRLDTPELKSRKGTGVGLYSCWKIVKLHGGRMDASSEEGQWAEFRFTIPQATDPARRGP